MFFVLFLNIRLFFELLVSTQCFSFCVELIKTALITTFDIYIE